MKIKHAVIFVILLTMGNFLRLYIEDKRIPDIEISEEASYKKEKAKKENDLSKTDKKFDVNSVGYDELLKLGFQKSKAEKIVEFRDEVGIISDIKEMKNIPRFGDAGMKQAKKYLYVDEEKIKKFVSYILKDEYKEEFDKNEYYLSLLITTNAQIQEINREYRQKDTPTDVISFAYNETENFGAMNMLGDIVISIERVKEQSSEYGHSDEREFYYVLCHGMLHLLGYDHIEEEDKVVMRRREEEILSKFNYCR